MVTTPRMVGLPTLPLKTSHPPTENSSCPYPLYCPIYGSLPLIFWLFTLSMSFLSICLPPTPPCSSCYLSPICAPPSFTPTLCPSHYISISSSSIFSYDRVLVCYCRFKRRSIVLVSQCSGIPCFVCQAIRLCVSIYLSGLVARAASQQLKKDHLSLP